MARVTVEDCIDKVDSPYELVLVAKERVTQLNSGIEPSLPRDNDKNTVVSLREISEEKVWGIKKITRIRPLSPTRPQKQIKRLAHGAHKRGHHSNQKKSKRV